LHSCELLSRYAIWGVFLFSSLVYNVLDILTFSEPLTHPSALKCRDLNLTFSRTRRHRDIISSHRRSVFRDPWFFPFPYRAAGSFTNPIFFLSLSGGVMSCLMASKIAKICSSCSPSFSSTSASLLANEALEATSFLRRTNARMIDMFTSIARSLFRTDDNIATPCSVNALGDAEECFKSLNRSQFVTSFVSFALCEPEHEVGRKPLLIPLHRLV